MSERFVRKFKSVRDDDEDWQKDRDTDVRNLRRQKQTVRETYLEQDDTPQKPYRQK